MRETPEAGRLRMVSRQLRRRGIRDERVLRAMATVPRELFVPEDVRAFAYEDEALPIGHGQTISQPYMVARICELLEVRATDNVLDVGTGSGYQAAVLAELGARVYSIERLRALADEARASLSDAGYESVEVHVGDGSLGLPEHAPYDAIAIAAAAPSVPAAIYDQLADDGRVVVPVGTARAQELQLVVRGADGPRVVRSVPCRFVPLLGREGFSGDIRR